MLLAQLLVRDWNVGSRGPNFNCPLLPQQDRRHVTQSGLSESWSSRAIRSMHIVESVTLWLLLVGNYNGLPWPVTGAIVAKAGFVWEDRVLSGSLLSSRPCTIGELNSLKSAFMRQANQFVNHAKRMHMSKCSNPRTKREFNNAKEILQFH